MSSLTSVQTDVLYIYFRYQLNARRTIMARPPIPVAGGDTKIVRLPKIRRNMIWYDK